MKTKYIITILGIIIASSIIFAIMISNANYFSKEHYEIKITGLKDVYLVGEQYSFSYEISGYGYACTDYEVTYPDENGDTTGMSVMVQCVAGAPMDEFVIKPQGESGKIGNTDIKNPGYYGVSVTFHRSTGFEPTQAGKGFHVVEKICDDVDAKKEAQCISDAFDSCTSAYAKQVVTTVEGDPIFVISVIESWNDCSLRAYLDTTHDRYGGHSTGVMRSICEDITIGEKFWQINNCSNFDSPPISYEKQQFMNAKLCEVFSGYWNYDHSVCADFSDEFDCIGLGGYYQKIDYAGEQSDNSKISDSFACMFEK